MSDIQVAMKCGSDLLALLAVSPLLPGQVHSKEKVRSWKAGKLLEVNRGSERTGNCQLRLKVPHSTGPKFPHPKALYLLSMAPAGAEPSAAFWRRVLGGEEAGAMESTASGRPS